MSNGLLRLLSFCYIGLARRPGGYHRRDERKGLEHAILSILIELKRETVGAVLFPIGLFWVPASSDDRSLHDLVCRTAVVYDWTRRVPPPAPQAA